MKGSLLPRGQTPVPRLHAVTDDGVLAREGWVRQALAVLDAGAGGVAVHLRGPRTSGRVLYDLTRQLVDDASAGWVIVNDRVDVALVTGADGVHLGARSLAVEAARRVLGGHAAIGRSLHAGDDASRTRASGADYAFVGNVFETPSHPGEPGIGIAAVGDFVAGVGDFPLLGIGGLHVDRVADVVRAGAHGVAAIRGVWDRPDPARAALEYLEALKGDDRHRTAV